MLVLSRKVGERLLIGETIVLTILEARGQRIRLGIEAPPEVPIWREEVSLCLELPSTRLTTPTKVAKLR